MDNKHREKTPAEVLQRLQDLLNEANALFSEYALPLTSDERQELFKMGDKSVSFVEKAFDYAKHYPQLCPSYLNMSDFDIDITDALGLRVLNISARQFADNIEDTAMVAGSEALQAALIFYNAAKTAADQNIPGAKEVYDDLKARFPSSKRKKEEKDI
jgi:hypothetical protein